MGEGWCGCAVAVLGGKVEGEGYTCCCDQYDEEEVVESGYHFLRLKRFDAIDRRKKAGRCGGTYNLYLGACADSWRWRSKCG